MPNYDKNTYQYIFGHIYPNKFAASNNSGSFDSFRTTLIDGIPKYDHQAHLVPGGWIIRVLRLLTNEQITEIISIDNLDLLNNIIANPAINLNPNVNPNVTLTSNQTRVRRLIASATKVYVQHFKNRVYTTINGAPKTFGTTNDNVRSNWHLNKEGEGFDFIKSILIWNPVNIVSAPDDDHRRRNNGNKYPQENIDTEVAHVLITRYRPGLDPNPNLNDPPTPNMEDFVIPDNNLNAVQWITSLHALINNNAPDVLDQQIIVYLQNSLYLLYHILRLDNQQGGDPLFVYHRTGNWLTDNGACYPVELRANLRHVN